MSTPPFSSEHSRHQRYQAFARIGCGGMAEVFLAVAPGAAVTKLVVLKRIWPELAADASFAAMFLNEARLAALMSHPNVVQTFDVIEQSGRLTMAMEYLDGQPLSRVMNRLSASSGMGQLTLAQRLRIVIDILAGLDHVHELTDYDGKPLGMVHRDVSPHNVVVTYEGHVKLMDFGVAKTTAAAQLTRPGAIKGKLAYMAPDQLWAGPIDRRADIFSVGVILWELLSERRFWSGMSEVDIVRHLSYGLPLPRLAPGAGLPAGVVEVCHRALALNPVDRFATAAEMQDELQRLLLPGLAASYARQLGKVVSCAFAEEREQRQALIDRHLLTMASRGDREDDEPSDDGIVTVETGCVDEWSSDADDTSHSETVEAYPQRPPGDEASLPSEPSLPSLPSLPSRPVMPPRRFWGWAAAGVAVVVLVGLLAFQTSKARRETPASRAAAGAVAALQAASSSARLPGAPSDPVSEERPPALPVVVAVQPQIELLPPPLPLGSVDPEPAEAARPIEPATAKTALPSSSPSTASGAGDRGTMGRAGDVRRPSRPPSRRAPGKRWALRDESWRLDESRAAKHRGSNPSSEAAMFSFEGGEAAPQARRREIDTISPFLP